MKKRPNICEDHYDDCGDDLTSLNEVAYVEKSPNEYNTDEELSDQDNSQCLFKYVQLTQCAYPIDVSKIAKPAKGGTPLPGADPRAPKREDFGCPSCRYRKRRDDWGHNRLVGDCMYPYDEPFIPGCEACWDRKPRLHEDHSYEPGKCVWGMADFRVRKASKPHEPQPKAHADPTVGAPAKLDGKELGKDGEDKAQEAEAKRQANQPSAPPPVPPGKSAGSGLSPEERKEGGGPAAGEEADSGSTSADAGGPKNTRGPDLAQRVRRAYQDQGDSPENSSDWSNFDIGRVVRLFRTNRPGAIRLSLRKLHVRWWHSSEHTMRKFLDRVGVSKQVLDLIPEVVQTCRVCREWTKPGPNNACNVEIADKFNQQVEADLLFIDKHIVFHMMDRSIRWHAAKVIPDKTETTLQQALGETWITIHGPPRELIMDGESGIMASETTQQFLRRKGITPHQRGKG